jgi:hypothetical protein
LPIVLYNGERRWTAPCSIQELIVQPGNGLQRYLPQLEFLLLDEGAIDENEQLALKNLAAALINLEKSPTPQTAVQTVSALIDWLIDPQQQSLRKAFTAWMSKVLWPGRLNGMTLPPIQDLVEVRTILTQSTIDWTRDWVKQGEAIGEARGKLEGKSQLLETLLRARFGALGDIALTRLHHATTEQLDAWALRVLTAATLAEVFE